MAARPSFPEALRHSDQSDLQHGLFQTPAESAQLRAAIYQVFGGSPWEGCCTHRLLEGKQQSAPKQQDAGATSSPFSCQGMMGRERWDLADGASEVLVALERKYQALQQKLCAEMLQAHYGHHQWASLAQSTKEEKLSEMMMLVELAVPEGSLLPLASLPGAGHRVSSGDPSAFADLDTGVLAHLATEPTAERALQQLRQRRQAEIAALLTQPHILEGRNPETSRQLLRLHAQAELVKKEATFQAALFTIELLRGERFWGSQPSVPEACHRQLAALRLVAGGRAGSAWQEAKMGSGRSMKQVLLDQLLLQQERDRSYLIKTLMVLVEPESALGGVHGSKHPTPLGAAGCHREETSPVRAEAVPPAPKQLQITQRAEALWQDCAITTLVALQQEQQEELSWAIEGLAAATSRREGDIGPTACKESRTQLQDPSLVSLAQPLWGVLPQEQNPTQETLLAGQKAFLAREQFSSAFARKPRLQREVCVAAQEVSKTDFEGLLPPALEVFPDQGQLQSDQEVLVFIPQKGHDPLQRTNTNAEFPRLQGTVQMAAGTLRSHGRPEQNSLWTQGLLQNLEGFQAEPHVVGTHVAKDLHSCGPERKNLLEAPHRQGNGNEQMIGLVPLEFPQSQKKHQGESEILDLPELLSANLQKCPGLSEKKEAEAIGVGKFGGLLDPSQQQEVLVEDGGPSLKIGVISQPRKPCGQQERVHQASVDPDGNQIFSQKKEFKNQEDSSQGFPFHKLNQDNQCAPGEKLRKTKSLGCLEFVTLHDLLLQGSRNPKISPQVPLRRLQKPSPPRIQMETVHDPQQTPSNLQSVLQQETGVTQIDIRMKATILKNQVSLPKGTETSVMKGKPDFQKREAPSKETQLSYPQGQTLVDTDHLHALKLQKNLREPQSFQQHAEKEPEVLSEQTDMARKPKPLQVDERPKLQSVSQLEDLHNPEETQEIGKGGAEVHQEDQLERPVCIVRDSLAVHTQDSISQRQKGAQKLRGLESPPLLWRVLWQKAKSFELMKRCVLPSLEDEQAVAQRMTQKEQPILQFPQEVKAALVVEPQKGSQVETENQKFRKSNIQNLNQLEVMTQTETQTEQVVLVEKCLQTDSQDFQHQRERTSESLLEAPVGQIGIPMFENIQAPHPSGIGEVKTLSVQEASQRSPEMLQRQGIPQREWELLEQSASFVQNLRGPQPPEKETPGEVQSQEDMLHKDVLVPLPQESRSLESPPLLWGAVGLRSKSFELRRPCITEAQELRETPIAQMERRSQRSLKSPPAQKGDAPDDASPQDQKEAESPPVKAEMGTFQVERILHTDSQESGSQDAGKPKISQPQEAGPERTSSCFLREKQALLGQGIREMDILQSQEMSREQTGSSEMQPREVVLTLEMGVPVLELGDQQNLGPPKGECVKVVLHPEECRILELPLLWRVLGSKAKSFELIKSRAFQMSCPEASYLTQLIPQQELQAPHIKQRQTLETEVSHSQMEPESRGSKMLHPIDLREESATQSHAGRSFHSPSCSQREKAPQILTVQPHLLRESKEAQAPESQELRDLQVLKAQAGPSSSQILQQEMEKPQAFHLPGTNVGALTSQPALDMKTRCLLHANRSSPETPPLLWWVLEQAQQGILHRELQVSPQLKEMSNYAPMIQAQGGSQAVLDIQNPMNPNILTAEKLQEPESFLLQKDTCQGEGIMATSAHLWSQEQRDPKFLPPEAQNREGSPVEQKTPIPMNPKSLEGLIQGDMSNLCDLYKTIESHNYQTLGKHMELEHLCSLPISAQVPELKPKDSEQCSLLDGSQVLYLKETANVESLKKVSQDYCPVLEALEDHSKLKDFLLLGKSKTFDLRELQVLKNQESLKKESLQAQAPTVLQVQKGLPMKLQEKMVSQTIISREKSKQDQGTPQLFQSNSSASESPPGLQNFLKQKSELPEMEPRSLQTQELREVIVQQPHEISKQQRIKNPQTHCLQGHLKGEICESGMEDKQSEMQGLLQRYPQPFHSQDTVHPQAGMFRKSKPLEFQKQSKANIVHLHELRELDILQAPEHKKEHPKILDDQVSSTVMIQEMLKPLQDTSILKKGEKSPTQKERWDLEQPKEKLGKNRSTALNSEENKHPQLQRQKETEVFNSPEVPQMENISLQILQNSPDNSGCSDRRHSGALRLGKNSLMSETLEVVKYEKSPTQLPFTFTETEALSSGWTLRKSTSLDRRRPQGLCSKSCPGKLDCSHLQTITLATASQPQRDRKDLKEPGKCKDPVAYFETHPLQECILKAQVLQEESKCDTPKMELDAQQSQEMLRNKQEIICSQELCNTQMFCPKKCRESEALQLQEHSQSLKESFPMNQGVQIKSDPQGPTEPQHHSHQEEGDLQSPPLLRNLPRKSKTLGHEEPTRRVDSQIPGVQKAEGSWEQVTLNVGRQSLQRFERQESPNIHKLSVSEVLQHQESMNVERIWESTEYLNSQGEATEFMKGQTSPYANQELHQEQGNTLCTLLQGNMSQVLPPRDIPQFGITFLQELGRLHNEIAALRPQDPNDGKALYPQIINCFNQSGQQIVTEPQRNLGFQVLQHQKWSGASSPQVSPDFSQAHKAQEGEQQILQSPKSQGPDQIPAVKRVSERSMGSPKQGAQQIAQLQERLPKELTEMPEVPVPHSHQVVETVETNTLGLQESLEVERGTALLAKSKTLESQPFLGTREFQGEGSRGVGGLLSWEKEMAVEPTYQEPLTSQAQVISSKSHKSFTEEEKKGLDLLVPENQRGPTVQHTGMHLQGKDERPQLPEQGGLKSQKPWKEQECQREMGTVQPQCMEEALTFQTQTWREREALPAEGAQPGSLSADGSSLLNLGNLEPEAKSRRLKTFPPWEQKATGTRAVTLLSPSSPGRHDEKVRQEPATLKMGTSSKTSPRLPPRPPCREKAFVWLSCQEKQVALQRLAEAQAKGERRHQRDKERQSLRFQERLSIAKRRKSKDDLLGPAERWSMPAVASKNQDQAGQKRAVKNHLEKVKQERTSVMQSKRERNTLSFKELLNPLATNGEESPALGQPEET